MMATWTQGTADEFIAMSRAGWEKGVKIHHFLGGQSIDVAGDRAVSQVKMEIHQRASVDGVEVDVTCTGRFYDFLEKRDGRWGLVLRQPIYEQDRMDSVDPAAPLELDADLLAQFPEGYRHLAYLQTRIGYDGEARHARAEGTGGRGALRERRRLALRRRSRPVTCLLRRLICPLRRFRGSGIASATSRSLKPPAAYSGGEDSRDFVNPGLAMAAGEAPYAGATPDGARTMSFRTEYQRPPTPGGVSGSSASCGSKSRSSDGLTANTASESR